SRPDLLRPQAYVPAELPAHDAVADAELRRHAPDAPALLVQPYRVPYLVVWLLPGREAVLGVLAEDVAYVGQQVPPVPARRPLRREPPVTCPARARGRTDVEQVRDLARRQQPVVVLDHLDSTAQTTLPSCSRS